MDKATPDQTTPKQEALRGLPPEWREALIENAAAMGIRAEHDTAWLLVKAFINAWAAAAAAGEAATATRKELAGLPEAIYRGTTKAAADLQGVVEHAGKGITELIAAAGKASIEIAAKQAATAIAEATAKLDTAASARREELIQEMQTAAAQAARDQIRAGLAGKMARSWSVVAGSLAFALLLGAGISIEAQYLDGKVLPWGWHTVRTGAGECGHVQIVIKGVAGPVLRTIEVCGATPD
ncbi:MAG: hypothetical protein ACYDBH_01805 [Acidobacteriaceae bacterium]